jgi:membrane protease YdiL (CAAX protease family)
MRRYLQALPLAAEFAIVILGAFGLFFLATFLALVGKTGSSPVTGMATYSGGHLVSVVIYEVPLGAALLGFLHLRGWSLARLGVRISARETLVGFGLAFLAEVACYLPLFAVALAFPDWIQAVAAAQPTPGGFGLATVIIASTVNAMFEETFVCGYVVSVVKERSNTSTAVALSVAIRLLYHLYQGPIAFFGAVPFGIVVSWWYARTGRLWPVIVAHGLGDFIAFVGYIS